MKLTAALTSANRIERPVPVQAHFQFPNWLPSDAPVNGGNRLKHLVAPKNVVVE